MRALLFVMVLGASFALPSWQHARSEEFPIQPFFGKYEGRTLFPMGEERNRELLVSIQRSGLFGFTVEWHTIIHKNRNEIVRKIQALDFEPATRANIYSARPPASQNDPSRNPTPVDGEPYAWARIAGQTLTVNVFTIVENGDFIIQIYERTLTKTGMSLDFTRLRNAKVERQIKAELKRVDGG